MAAPSRFRLTIQTSSRLRPTSNCQSYQVLSECFATRPGSKCHSAHVHTSPETKYTSVGRIAPARSYVGKCNYPFRGVVHSPPNRTSPTGQGDSTQDQSIVRLRELLLRLDGTNSRLEKEDLLRSYPDLEGLLTFILDPQIRLHIRSTKILKAVESDLYEVKGVDSQDADCNALTLFERLDRREVTGNRALGVVLSYLRRSQILDEFKTGASKNQSLTLLDVFLRCLDRNFKVGVSYKTVRAAFQEEDAPAEQKQNVEGIYDRSVARNVALGRQVLEEELADMLCITNGDESNEWFLSRKLDGVRCIVRVDLEQRRKDQLRQASRWHVYDITSFSRTGRSFNTLQNIEKVIRQRLEESSTLGSIIDDAYRNGQELHPSEGKGVARMYIDGEVCMAVQAMHTGARYVSDQEHTFFREQFQSVAGPIRRKDFQLQDARFFPFDMLLYSEMTQWRDAEQNRQDLRSRLKRLECLFSHPQEAAQQDRHTLMSLEQTLVTSVQQVRDLQEYAILQGWEGLILRRNTPFEGRRSASIRKLKQSKEAEYVVVDVELTTMRLSIGQKYAQRKALASAIISHNGHRVNVGSGFSTEQRLRYAENPDLLIGKEITVEYFEESRSHNRSDRLTSLRFPRVKAVWETGKRDM